MRQSAETENLMTSVERALEYAKLEPEAPLESEPGMNALYDLYVLFGLSEIRNTSFFSIYAML